MSDALPLPPRPNLEQYKKLARDLQRAVQSDNPAALRQWAERWVSPIEPLHGPANWESLGARAPQPQSIVRRWNEFQKCPGHAEATLAAVQLFLAREHGFASWPRFPSHVRELARNNSSVSAFEAAADAIVHGDIPALRRLLAA